MAVSAKAALVQELQKAGIDPNTLKVSYWEGLCWFPAGNFVVRQMTIQAPNGEKVDVDAQLTQQGPSVTVQHIKDLLDA